MLIFKSYIFIINYYNFDVIFIDGGHDYNIAKADIDNCQRLSHSDTIIILDDTMYTRGWQKEYTLGPTKIWNEYLNSKIIIEINNFLV